MFTMFGDMVERFQENELGTPYANAEAALNNCIQTKSEWGIQYWSNVLAYLLRQSGRTLMKVLDDASYVKDDPVRPSLSYAFRKSVGEIFYIGEDKPDAIVCVAYTSDIPTTVRELALYAHRQQ